jgi:uncharacterized protein YeaO (DUF488 family)
MPLKTKRIYEEATKADGYRILVDRLWPRGIRKEDAAIDLWLKEVAPSTELRKWFHGDKGDWTEFKKKYKAELKDAPALEELRELAGEHKTITLLYAAKDEEHNHAQVLQQLIDK